MGFEIKNAANQKIAVVLGVLLILSLVSFGMKAKNLKELTVKVKQQALIIEEKNKQLEADKIQYTSLAARLHKEIKKSGEMEEELKKYKRGR